MVVSIGDPCGIGPEVTLKALSRIRAPRTNFVLVGPEETLVRWNRRLGNPVRFGGGVRLEPCGRAPRRAGPASGRAAFETLDRAVEWIEKGAAQALVTAPVSKRWIAACGVPFRGHTEYLAGRAGVKATMAFVSKRFLVSLVTTHLPLSAVPEELTASAVLRAIRHTDEFLRRIGRGRRIAVAGLNPHAGEDGRLGLEEKRLIAPAVARASRAGILCEGPYSPDSIFRRRGFDAFVSMYHDHGLTAVKTVDPAATNVTLGLGYVRTSPDHGVAFDIAGLGVADPEPMRRALLLACRLAAGDRREGGLAE